MDCNDITDTKLSDANEMKASSLSLNAIVDNLKFNKGDDEGADTNNKVVLISDVRKDVTPEMTAFSVGEDSKVKCPEEETLESIKKKQNELLDEIMKFRDSVKPIEFESYYDYFTLKNFKRGISASGQVDFNMLRRREHGIYYKKIKLDKTSQGNANDTNSTAALPITTTTTSTGNMSDNETNPSVIKAQDDDDKITKEEDFNESKSTTPEDIVSLPPRITRSQNSQTSINNSVTSKERRPVSSQFLDDSKKLINGDISVQSIIPNKFLGNNRRRSSRISKRITDKCSYNNSSNENSDNEESGTSHIQTLFERIIPKTLDPIRRSDWILQTKDRFSSEKHLQTHPQYTVIKMNELVSERKIQFLLSKFEGGLAGVRKK
ncbi:hypothetical protein TPHA_0G01350 [Tetrapisispora phaffii CBS 4417]|uniref:Uncharacterized protein n=1 Tax=Tetrapisispora phaffii (strain ATCC 24235 / CBS 4417 / NBRC 1672 / NRRL Y-8282 / UCD 70-5) TaxID=1071381 RepID=G8BVP4_TETPH|nr:hypothetical protein TPHA_0G01350 [Tetrapisispora phaffii CBS 4417]CCE63972.1 hypothetical protein TPHA_0G01350 [Tetrapisispora phaffii CBS 4417]